MTFVGLTSITYSIILPHRHIFTLILFTYCLHYILQNAELLERLAKIQHVNISDHTVIPFNRMEVDFIDSTDNDEPYNEPDVEISNINETM